MINGSNTPESERDTWATPPNVFNWSQGRFGIFHVDLAANSRNHLCQNWYGEGGIDPDAFNRTWGADFPGGMGWCNPPYSDIPPWVDKAIKEAENDFTTVMLIPTPNGEKYTQGIFQYAKSVTFIIGRISFIGANGKPKNGNPRGSVLIEFSKKLPWDKAEAFWIDRELVR